MDIRRLKYFVTICEEGNISKAAKKLHIAQPPLSQQLKLLEDELGTKLFERDTRNIKITDAGKTLLYKSKQILELMDSTIKEVRDVNDGLTGKLSIGTVSSAGATILPQLISNFHNKFPHISFEIIDEDTPKITELLTNGLIDIGIIRTPYNLDGFQSISLTDDPMIVISKKVYWNDNTKSLYLKDLSGVPLLVQRRYEQDIISLCNQAGFEPNIICRSNDVRTIILWSISDMGLAIVPKNCIHLIPNTNLFYKELNEPSLRVGTSIIWSDKRYNSSATRHFIECLDL